MSSAQDEFDRLIQANRDSSRTHPEDRDQSDNDSSPAEEHNHSAVADDHYELSDADSDYGDHVKRDNDAMVSRTATYTVPTTVFEANTGPKGVIADAQSFERARKKSFRRTLLSAAGLESHSRLFGVSNNITSQQQQQPIQTASSSPPSDEDEEFMRRWRESRLQELQERSQRRPSPSKRVYGRVDTVDAEGYLNAIERVASDTVVVVCIYDPESSVSSQVEDAIEVVARKQSTTRFVKLHHEIAEMSHIEAPALLAYKAGDVICTLVDIPRQIPRGGEISANSIEDLFKQYVTSFC
ncbi:phosducin, putative [Talaromyces stipitatus ATCC 10500]|uniref:Phosducin, putative n=1 Tax=Talaromyces stipitatus (strain ATCC 10500 / CBS 375.48 / QM 6759 / NRRL 1006) TaxID=441959 RepID=B8M355_TALSN|nr:phosducin, putative [Talaromyces stipitatus ATCC 10500]EED22031.1 phosducin, putative [Talaromyces stipitatus ATCC 10500]